MKSLKTVIVVGALACGIAGGGFDQSRRFDNRQGSG